MNSTAQIGMSQEFPFGWTISVSGMAQTATPQAGWLCDIVATPPNGSPYVPMNGAVQVGIFAALKPKGVYPADAWLSGILHDRFGSLISGLGRVFVFCYKGCRSVPGHHHRFDGDPSLPENEFSCLDCGVAKPAGGRLFGLDMLRGGVLIAHEPWDEMLAKDAILRPIAAEVSNATLS